MFNYIKLFLIKILDCFLESLDHKFFSNIFILLEYPFLNQGLFGLKFQDIIIIVVSQLHFFLTLLILFYIFLALLKNMFGFSLEYFYINYIFDLQLVPLKIPVKFSPRGYVLSRLLKNSKFFKKKILPFLPADTMSSVCAALYVLVFFNSILYYNFFSFSFEDLGFCTVFEYNFQNWISYNSDVISFGFIIDHLSLLMLVVVLTISTLVHYYSLDYMSTDPWLLTFLKYLSGFTLAMVILVTSNNMALLFLGWEGVGIFSYLLIGFWYTWTLALKASLKAVIVNRIGDAALILATALTLQYFGTIEFRRLQALILYIYEYKFIQININFFLFDISVITLISFFLLIAAVGKSAQFGLHTWLPDAMEGPTPVSALIHAATMVTAGVYLIVWMSFFFEMSDNIWNATLMIGSFTALFGSVTASFQHDIKRIIAFSTCSQLGYMFLACGLSAYNLAMFHLFIHAFFKALLFLCAGSVIHAIGDEQDVRRMGGLYYYLPITYTGLCIGFFSLAGLPFTSGFFSKDTIIELALTKRTVPGAYAYICASIGAFYTAFYSFRFLYHVFYKESQLSASVLMNTSEHGRHMLFVIFLLTLVTIFIGGFTKNPFSSPFSFIFFSDSFLINDSNFYFNFYESFIKLYRRVHMYAINYLKWIILLTPFCAIYLSIITYWYWPHYSGQDLIWDWGTGKNFDTGMIEFSRDYDEWNLLDWTISHIVHQRFFETKGSMDQFYNFLIVKPLLDFSYQISYKELDKGWLEFFFIKIPTFIVLFIAKVFNQNFGSLKLNFLPGVFFLFTIIAYIIYLILN